MFDKDMEREFIKDTFNKKHQEEFEIAERRAKEFIKKHRSKMTVSQVLQSLTNTQKNYRSIPNFKESSYSSLRFQIIETS